MTEYGYDGLNRLVEEKHTSGADITTSRYFYDENGNMTKKEVEGSGESVYEHYSYNEADQLMKQTGTKGQVLYSYDNNGNMLTKRTNGETETQTYDAMNRLISWTDGEVDADYTYDINNKRAFKTVDGVRTEHIWIGEEIQIDKIDGEMVSYVHGIRLIESEYGFYLYNAHGDVVQVVRENQIAARYDFNAYGQLIGEYAEDENDCNPYRYAGEYQDKETGYIYLRARYYDPEISRFLNMDPIRDGMNWYGYTGGNPVRYTDPSGLSRETEDDVDESKGRAIRGRRRIGTGGLGNSRGRGRKFSIKEESSMKTPITASESLITFLKNYEKFYDKPYVGLDNQNRTVGYGHVIDEKTEWKKYNNGITDEEATELLKNDLDRVVYQYLNPWISSNSINLSQQEYDALVSFTFNAGPAWVTTYEDLRTILSSESVTYEKMHTEFMEWTKVKEVQALGLYRRRMDELNIYFNGDYSRNYIDLPN